MLRMRQDAFRRLAGIYLGVVAMLLAIASLGGSAATKEMLSANIHASDTYAFYQAKYLRQIHYQTTADLLETVGTAGDAAHTAELIKRYRQTAARYESEPETGDGKKELLAKAKDWEARREHRGRARPQFRVRRGLAADRDRARLGQHRRRVALAARPQRRPGGLWRGVDAERVLAAGAARALGGVGRDRSR